MIRVIIVDDHPVVRVGLIGILHTEADIELVGEAGDADEALRLVTAVRPDVVLMDLRLPGRDGVAATAEIRQAVPSTQVLVLTSYGNDTDILRAIDAGATGYVLKDSPGARLVEAVRAAVLAETVLAPPPPRPPVSQPRDPHPADALSPRELAVLRLVAQGLANAEIGRRLYVAESTVKTHLLRAFAKLGVADRTAAVTMAIAGGHLSPEECGVPGPPR